MPAKQQRTVGKTAAQVFEVYTNIRAAEVKLSGADGSTRALPEDLHVFLTQLMRELRAGRAVTLFDENAELTTTQASRILAVSRQFLVGLLEQNRIPFHRVGTHRRIYARDVLAFRASRDTARRRVLDGLSRAEVAEAIYDRVPISETQSG